MYVYMYARVVFIIHRDCVTFLLLASYVCMSLQDRMMVTIIVIIVITIMQTALGLCSKKTLLLSIQSIVDTGRVSDDSNHPERR